MELKGGKCSDVLGRKVLVDLHELAGINGSMWCQLGLRSAPVIDVGSLVYARHRAVRCAALLGEKFAANVFHRVVLQRCAGKSALLRAVVHQPVFADVYVTRARAASPLVRLAMRNIVL